MILNDKVGFKVTNRLGNKGSIVKIDGNYISIDFGSRKMEFNKNAFVEGFLSFDDPALQAEIDAEIKAIEAEKARIAEEQRIAAEREAEERRMRAEEAARIRLPVNIDELFGKDYHVEHLKRQPILTYQEVEKQFGIKISGFGKGINPTGNSVVLISSIEKKHGAFVYHDHWTEDGDYIYSGEGKTGDQQMNKGNAAIKDAARDGKALYLFVKLSPSEYYFQGRVTCVEYTYEDDEDENGRKRKEYKFKLKLIDEII